MEKYCGIFETLSDKRLQTHLFQGLVTLVKKAVNESVKASSENFTENGLA